MFKKIESKDKTKLCICYSCSKTKIIIGKSDTDDVFQWIQTTVTSKIQKYLGKGSGCIIYSVTDYAISISKYNLWSQSSYNWITKRIKPSKKRLD